jgi:hypothetical protein
MFFFAKELLDNDGVIATTTTTKTADIKIAANMIVFVFII